MPAALFNVKCSNMKAKKAVWSDNEQRVLTGYNNTGMHKGLWCKRWRIASEMCSYPEAPSVTVTASAVLSFPFQVTDQQHPVNVFTLCMCVFLFFPPTGERWIDTVCVCVSKRVFVSVVALGVLSLSSRSHPLNGWLRFSSEPLHI